jgi:eukaryotic-like serine/threonine-protein kinase
MIGRTFGHYQVIEELGAGGMGVVYRARDHRLSRDVAFKVLPAELSADPERLARFEREATALAALSHPHIVTIHTVEEAEGVRFLTMELVEGETLERRIPPGGMTLERFLEVAIPLAEALAAAHGRGVLHRDLKPANVMVTEEGRVKVLDFGLAKLAGEPAGDLMEVATETLEELTREGRIVGTAPYMSPEQLQGMPLDARSDIFSLGAVLYEMATGRRPFAGGSAAELVSSILRDEPSPVTDLRPELPRQLGRILRHCLAKDPARRFQTAQDLRNELEELREELSETRAVERFEDRLRRQGASDDQAVESATAAPPRWRRLAPPSLLAIPLVVAGLLWLRPGAPSAPDAPSGAQTAFARTALAVLPFQNLSADPADAYFAGGLHDELLTQLSRVAALSPRGRTSVMGYAETTKPLSQIAEELQVGAVVEGSVQVVAGHLRVGVRLLDAATGDPLWAERYDRPLEDAFAIQSDVAQRVVAAVGAALASDERRAIAEAPTANAEAYQLYLQGREYFRRPGYQRQNFEIAQQLYERAVELDPEFALAHASLAAVHFTMHWFRYDTSPVRVAAGREAAETALRFAPDLPQALAVMSGMHLAEGEPELALRQLELALRHLPNDAELVGRVGYRHRRLLNWQQALLAYERAGQLDPRDANLHYDLGGHTLLLTKRYEESVRAFESALALTPDFHAAAVWKGWTEARWRGQLDTLRQVLPTLPRESQLPHFGSPDAHRAELLLWGRDADGLIDLLATITTEVFDGQMLYFPKSLYAAWANELQGHPEEALASFEAALATLDSAALERPDDWRVRSARGLALAGLHRHEALEEARWLERPELTQWLGFLSPWAAEDRARILARIGDVEAALDEIEWLLASPSWLSVHTLRLDPRWDPIRDQPRFQALLAKHAEP